MPDLNLHELNKVNRVLLTVPLRPVQGDRFQPTGFPSLGAAAYQTREGPKLLVESTKAWPTGSKQPAGTPRRTRRSKPSKGSATLQ